MRSLAEFILSLLQLFEAEGNLLRANVLRTARGCGLIVVGVVFVAVAIAFFVAAVYELLISIMPSSAVFALMGLICGAIALCLIWSANKCGRIKQKDIPTKNS